MNKGENKGESPLKAKTGKSTKILGSSSKRSSLLPMLKNLVFYSFVIYLLYSLTYGIYIHFIRNPTSWKEYQGEWAIVTGASYGIGEEYAKQLALKGLNVVLIARSEDKLKAVVEKIKAVAPKAQTKLVLADFSLNPYEEIKKAIAGLKVTVLINNVGGSSISDKSGAVDFAKVSEEIIMNDVNLNLVSALRMTRMVLPSMKELNKGRILTVSSISAYQSIFSSIYTSLKAGLTTFSKALRTELKILGYDGIEVVVSSTGFVDTPMLSRNRDKEFMPPLIITSQKLVEQELDKFGTHAEMIADLQHYLTYSLAQFGNLIPESVLIPFFKVIINDYYPNIPYRNVVVKTESTQTKKDL